DTRPRATYTLSLHDALPIFRTINAIVPAIPSCGDIGENARVGALVLREMRCQVNQSQRRVEDEHAFIPNLEGFESRPRELLGHRDRKSTRLNSSHVKISYAV